MLKIDYHTNKFHISFNSESPEQFQEYIIFCKYIDLSYSDKTKTWLCPEKRIDELLLWIDRKNYYFTFTDEAENKFNEIQKQWNTPEVKFYRNVKFDKDIIIKSNKVNLIEKFQEDDILYGLSRSSSYNFNGCGLGKSIEAISIFTQRLLNNEVDGIFILVKTGITYNWKCEILDWVNESIYNEDDILLINNTNKFRPFEFNVDKKIIICPDHLIADVMLSYRKEIPKSKKHIRFDKNPDIHKLWSKKNIFFVYDESHRFKWKDRIRSKQTFALKEQFPFRYLLTGTPGINEVSQIRMQLDFIDRSITGMSDGAFNLWLSEEMGTKYNKYEITKYNTSNVKILKDKMRLYGIQRLLEDHIIFKKHFRPIYLDLKEKTRKLYQLLSFQELNIIYEDFDRIYFKQIENKFPYIMPVFDNPEFLKQKTWEDSEIQKLVQGYNLDKDDAKFEVCKNLLEDYVEDRNEKVIIFFQHPFTGNMLFEKFKKYNPLIIHGQVDVKDKDVYKKEVEDKFNNSDENKIALLSLFTSAEAINMNKRCKRIIVYEPPYSGESFDQSQFRIFRINNTSDVFIDYLVYRNTLDMVRLERNQNREEFNKKLLKNVNHEDLKKLLQGIMV